MAITWERAALLASRLCCFILDVFLGAYVTPLPFGVLGRMWNSIVSVLHLLSFCLNSNDDVEGPGMHIMKIVGYISCPQLFRQQYMECLNVSLDFYIAFNNIHLYHNIVWMRLDLDVS